MAPSTADPQGAASPIIRAARQATYCMIGGSRRMLKRILAIAFLVAVVAMPPAASAQSTVDTVVNNLDAFWAQQFANAGLTYTSPNIRAVDSLVTTPCGPIAPEYGPGAYCAGDQTIYYSTLWAPDDPNGSVVWWTVLGHEWGHHVQWLVDTGISSVLESEQQADCFSGAFASYAQDAGLVSSVDVTLGLSLTQSAGDVWYEVPEGSPEHGNKADRASSFMFGMNNSVTGCGFPGV